MPARDLLAYPTLPPSCLSRERFSAPASLGLMTALIAGTLQYCCVLPDGIPSGIVAKPSIVPDSPGTRGGAPRRSPCVPTGAPTYLMATLRRISAIEDFLGWLARLLGTVRVIADSMALATVFAQLPGSEGELVLEFPPNPRMGGTLGMR